MLLRKVLIVLCALSLILSLPLLAQANNTRLTGLGLSEYTTDWMVQDPGNIFYNPSYVNLYGNYAEVNSIDPAGTNPYGIGILKLGNALTFGVSLNSPLYSTYSPLYSTYLNSYNYATLLPFTGFYSSAATAPSNANGFSTYKLAAFGGLDLGAMKLGVLYAYGAGVSNDYTKSITIPNNPDLNTTQTIKNSNSQSVLGAGILFNKLGPLELAFDGHYIMPSLYRENTLTATSAYNYTRSITGDSASALNIGSTVTCKTSDTNALIGRVAYVSDNCEVTVLDKEDQNGNGVFTDGGDQYITDYHTQTYSGIQFGLADRFKLMDNGFIFVGASYSINNAKQKISGRSDGALTGPNYTGDYELSSNWTLLPVIIGGELPVTKWLTVCFAASRPVLQAGASIETKNTYTPGTTTLVGTTTTASESVYDAITTFNLGANVTLGKVGIYWLLRKEFVSDGGLLSSSTGDSLSTKFTVSVKM